MTRLVVSKHSGVHPRSFPAPTQLLSHHGRSEGGKLLKSAQRGFWVGGKTVSVLHFSKCPLCQSRHSCSCVTRKEGLAVGSGSASVFYHFFIFVPWLLSWAWQHLCATFRGWTTLSRYNPGQKCREMGAQGVPGDTSPVPNSHAAKHLLVLRKGKICPGLFSHKNLEWK